MSEMGHKRPSHRAPKSTFVRFGPIADKRGCGWIVGFVPIATDAPQQTVALFDHLISKREQLCWHVKAKRLRSLEVDHELKFCGLHHRQVGGLFAL